MTSIKDLNIDQKKVILALENPEEFYRGHHGATGIRGVTYKKIQEKSELTIEKTLLSLGWLEAIGFVSHDVAMVKKTLDYLGQSITEIADPTVIRMFYLTEEGKKILRRLIEERKSSDLL
ncbi:MAG: hypothetical protein ACFFE8_00990 [Candidatus Heimdallarchaeota archaeon]